MTELYPDGESNRKERDPYAKQSYRILLIEDNLYNRELMQDYLQTCLGLHVLAVAGGQEALSNLSTFQPHLILLDLKLPDIDGFAVLRAMADRSLKIPVLVVSACAQQADKERAISLGAARYFVKPTCLTELCEAIESILGQPMSCQWGDSRLSTPHS